MEAGSPGVMATISGKNHNGADLEWKKRLEVTKEKIRQAIATMRREFAGVTEPSERPPPNDQQQDEVFPITPDQIVEVLGGITLREEASEGNPDENLVGKDANGNVWAVDIRVKDAKIDSMEFLVIRQGKTPLGVDSVRYVPQHGRYVPGEKNAGGSWTTESATLKIVGKDRELVFKSPVKEAAPTASHPS